MLSGKLPQDWVTANVVPVLTKGDPCLPSSYRPIILTSVIVKMVERIVCCQIGGSTLSDSCQFSDYQHGVCPKHSTISFLLTNGLFVCLECRITTHCIFLDYAKAFDSVPHECLLFKLNAMGSVLGPLLFLLCII